MAAGGPAFVQGPVQVAFRESGQWSGALHQQSSPTHRLLSRVHTPSRNVQSQVPSQGGGQVDGEVGTVEQGVTIRSPGTPGQISGPRQPQPSVAAQRFSISCQA